MFAKTLKISSLAFVIVVIAGYVACQILAQKDVDKRVLVDLPALPDPFTNDKLPSSRAAAAAAGGVAATISATQQLSREKCYSMMGCYEELPITSIPQNPLNMRTEFRMYYKEMESVLEFGRYENCLKSQPNECEQYPFNLQTLLDAPFKPSRRTIVVIGGYMSKAPSSWELSLKDLWAQLDDVNVILLCWTGGNSGLYQTAAANTRPVARQLTVLLYYLAKLKNGPNDEPLELSDDVFTEKLYMIGHSLGAHIAGFVGQDLNGRPGRITGLDPAGPSFDVQDRRFRIDRTDAQLVDIMHTNAGSKIFTAQTQYGSALASGHYDLWANDGSHQPGCSNDMLGCSHKRASKYYEAFLNHQLSMRNFLPAGKGSRPAYRLTAYAADSFDEFHNGTSLMRRCPVTALDDDDLKSADLDACSIPIDYVGWFDTVRQELASQHGIDFSPAEAAGGGGTPMPRNFYFYTTASTTSADQMDHYLVRIRVSKSAYEQKQQQQQLATGDGPSVLDKVNGLFNKGGCDVGFELEMASGTETEYKIKRYRLLDKLDHMEIAFPFLSPNIVSKYELAKLDATDFYVERKADKDFVSPSDLEHLRQSLVKIFPALISVRGFNNGEQAAGAEAKKKKKGGLLGTISRLFDGFGSSSSSKKKEETSLDHADCQLAIESFSIQPLRRFHRHISAVYTRDCSSKKEPLNIVLLDANEPSPKTEMLIEAADACKEDSGNSLVDFEPKLSLKTVIVGPHLELPAVPTDMVAPNDFTTEESRIDVTNSIEDDWPRTVDGPTRRRLQEDAQDVGGTQEAVRSNAYLWLILTLLLLLCMLGLMFASMLAMMQRRRAPANKSAVAMTNPNHQSTFIVAPPSDIKLTTT